MLQSLINDFDSLSPEMQASIGELIHGMAIQEAIQRANERQKKKVIPFNKDKGGMGVKI